MSLSNLQIENARIIRDELNAVGISQRLVQCAIISVCYKESALTIREENLNYSEERISQCFPKLTSALIAQFKLARNPQALGDYLYSGKYGNGQGEGYKYRGRGFNQITFKNIYKHFGDLIGIDLVKSPELMNQPKIAAAVLARFFKETMHSGFITGKFEKHGAKNYDEIITDYIAIRVAIQCNAGLGTKWDNPIVQEGYQKATEMFDTINKSI
jgi:predicted chitinase